MKIGIIGATGHAGSAILQEGLRRNLDVTAIVRSPEKLEVEVPFIKKDLYDLTKEDLKDFDVVVDAFNAPKGKEEMHQTSMEHLIDILTGSRSRLIVVGGASSLYVDDEKTTKMIDQMPKDSPFFAVAFNMYEASKILKATKELTWTYVSPAAFFNPSGEETGNYQINDGILKHNSNGKSEISMKDYALAIMDIIEDKSYLNHHIGVVEK